MELNTVMTANPACCARETSLQQVAQMIKLLLGLDRPPSPFDATDALAVAICHLHTAPRVSPPRRSAPTAREGRPRTWRDYRPSR